MTGQDTNTRPGRGPVKYRIYREADLYLGMVNGEYARTGWTGSIGFRTLRGCRRACVKLAKQKQREGLVESGELGD